ncbi:hypothetical protein CWE17_03540 [Synechococcus sp. BS56D]|uniref:hypothetical protein n=1 Tax=Synechococcus sp. BS56D TaxID=2055944 RepID=UPI00103FB174|nr:hypothetical protein [Synechococcus sp. BS56D]TCD58958.1 hypothetical protein CWE17_03540 [Synechococcus sp. BS56D]
MLRSLSLLSAVALSSTALVIAHGPKTDPMPMTYDCFDRGASTTVSSGVIQAPSQVLAPMLSAWAEIGEASPSFCMKASVPQTTGAIDVVVPLG